LTEPFPARFPRLETGLADSLTFAETLWLRFEPPRFPGCFESTALKTSFPILWFFAPDALKRAGIREAKCVIVATSSDKVNILVCQAIRAAYDKIRLVARVNQTANLAAFERAGIEVMSPPQATAAILENLVLRPSFFNFLSLSQPFFEYGEKL
jgi:voltage-gated potassium channel Kch